MEEINQVKTPKKPHKEDSHFFSKYGELVAKNRNTPLKDEGNKEEEIREETKKDDSSELPTESLQSEEKSSSEKKFLSEDDFTIVAHKEVSTKNEPVIPFVALYKYKVPNNQKQEFLQAWFKQKKEVMIHKGCLGATINEMDQAEDSEDLLFCLYTQWVEKKYWEEFVKKGHTFCSSEMEQIITEYFAPSFLSVVSYHSKVTCFFINVLSSC